VDPCHGISPAAVARLIRLRNLDFGPSPLISQPHSPLFFSCPPPCSCQGRPEHQLFCLLNHKVYIACSVGKFFFSWFVGSIGCAMAAIPPVVLHPGVNGAPPVYKITRGHSCALCQQRKVRCDGQRPCSNCTKARANCVGPPLSRPRRRKPEEQVLARLKRCEELLQKHGLKLDDPESGISSPTDGRRSSKATSESSKSPDTLVDGELMIEAGNSRYIER
jgi:hypothetical protein